MDQWINNFANNQFVFKVAASTDTFTMAPIQTSLEHEATKGCVGADKGCDATLYLTSLQQASPVKFAVDYRSSTGWDNSTTKGIRIQLKDLQVSAVDVSDTGFVFHANDVLSNYQPSMSIGGRTFNQVQLIQTDTSIKASGAYKMYFAKNMGLIAYEEYPSHQLWIRQ